MALQNSGAALFAGSVEEFISQAPASKLTAHLTREFNRRWGTAGESEIRAWKSSLTALADVVAQSELDRMGVGIELKLPLTDKRVDASFIARDRSGHPHVVLLELKQWEDAAPSFYPDNVVVMGREMLSPAVQVSAYAQYLRDSHSAFSELGYRLSAGAYLHNMPGEVLRNLPDPEPTDLVEAAAMFSRDDVETLIAFLEDGLAGGDGLDLLPELIHGRYRPSPQLIAGIARALEESSVWTLLDEQRLAFNIVRGSVGGALSTGKKSCVIVLGGPGTGKSVVAAHLVVEMAKDGNSVVHATGSKAFTTNLRGISPNPRSAAALFRYFNNFRHQQTDPDAIDILVADEAHRIRETSNDRFTKTSLQSEISQARELVRAAKVSVFFLDERQNVRPGEIGTVESIREAAIVEGAAVAEIELTGQFRCNGCSGYLEWVDALVSENPALVGSWFEANEYDVRISESPQEMETELLSLARAGSTARLVAGFCWPWSDPRPDNTLPTDVQIGSWKRPWNEKPPEQRRPPKPPPRADRHPYYLWANEPERIREIGCIYSAQGLEFAYCGVIMGPDLVWRHDLGWISDKQATADPALLRRKLSAEGRVDLMAQTYRVLLTRGIKGTFIYSTDAETMELLQSLVKSGQ
ncbi:MAG: DUF2075 domain-containing protein [Gemmatimonadales bacterium]